MNWAVAAGQVITILLAVATLIWQSRRDRNQPVLQSAQADHTEADKDRLRLTITQMANESNAYRDTRLWQLEGYLNLDAGWHLHMVTQQRILISLVKEMRELLQRSGISVEHIIIPDEPLPPPPIPDPPRNRVS